MLDAVLKKAGKTEPGFTRKTVKWAITCTSDGRYTGVVTLSEGKGQDYLHCPSFSFSELVGGGETRSHFLAENLSTVALYWKDGVEIKEQERSRAKHEYFCKLLEDAASASPYLSVAAKTLTDENILS